jgi:glucuronoarabinoxylan endo-1,4-beta-xylanase
MNMLRASITGIGLAFSFVACTAETPTPVSDTGGTTSSTGGSPSGTGGSTSGGSSTGGTQSQGGSATGGISATTGGTSNPTGGTANPSGGARTGGTTGMTGGTANPSGGTANPSGGTANPSGGTANPTGGTANPSGGARTGGTTGMTGGAANPSGGTANPTGGTANPSGGAATGGTNSTAVTIQLGQTKQTIEGFGINNNWAPAMTDAEADAMFSTTGSGIGLNILRVGMGSNGAWMNTNSPQDISKAKARGAKYIIGTLWSPPANCKTNNSENDGGHLLTSCYDSWSTTIANFAKNNGIYAMSPQNEPDFASCGTVEPCNGNYPTTLFTANEMVAFLKVVGPKLRTAGVKVMVPEASEWIHNWSNTSATGSSPGNKNSSDPLKCGCFGTSTSCASTCTSGGGYDYGHWLYKDSTAWGLVDIMGVHQYDSQVAEPWPADVPDKKPVWQTEMSGVKWWPEQGPSSDINNGVAVAGWILNALTVGEASAWLWWWYKANNTDDNEGLLLKSGADTKRHYTLGNYSKFVKSGYTRVDITGTIPANVLLSAYKGSDGTVVVVAINKSTSSVTVPITIAGGTTTPATMTPNVTSSSDNLAAKTAVTVSGGSFTATLAATTVTTFVGK